LLAPGRQDRRSREDGLEQTYERDRRQQATEAGAQLVTVRWVLEHDSVTPT
jgi:hypothetical protein